MEAYPTRAVRARLSSVRISAYGKVAWVKIRTFLGIISFCRSSCGVNAKSNASPMKLSSGGDKNARDTRSTLVCGSPEVGVAFRPLHERVGVTEGVDVLGLSPIEPRFRMDTGKHGSGRDQHEQNERDEADHSVVRHVEKEGNFTKVPRRVPLFPSLRRVAAAVADARVQLTFARRAHLNSRRGVRPARSSLMHLAMCGIAHDFILVVCSHDS